MSLSINKITRRRSSMEKANDSSSSMMFNTKGLRTRDIEFMSHSVTVLNKIGGFGNSFLYSAKLDAIPATTRKSWRVAPLPYEPNFLVKATAASTLEEIQRAETEVKLLRTLRNHSSILKLIDCGFSVGNEDCSDTSDLRLYCLLFEPCPDCSLLDFITNQRRRQKQGKPRGLFAKLSRKSIAHQKYLHTATVLDIFRQMCEGIEALHSYQKPRSRKIESKQKGIMHFDITPSRFMIRKIHGPTKTGKDNVLRSFYEVKLCSFGCCMEGPVSLRREEDRIAVSKMLEALTADIYRAPEMVNFQLNDELTDRCDIWGLGCCLYALLFLKECFKDSSCITIMNSNYKIPHDHPFGKRIMALLGQMLAVSPDSRPDIYQVIDCIEGIREGHSFPLRRQLSMQITGTTRYTSGSKKDSDELPLSINVRSCKESMKEPAQVEMGNEELKASYNHYHERALSDSAALSLCQSNHGSNSSVISAMGKSLPNQSPLDESDSTSENTQWLEFQPGQPNNTARRKSDLRRRASQIRLIQRLKTTVDPLSLGQTECSRRKKEDTDKRDYNWPTGGINRMSSRSLNNVDHDHTLDDRSDDYGFTVLKPPSNRNLSLRSITRSGQKMSSAAASLLKVEDPVQNCSPLNESEDVLSSFYQDDYNGDESAWGLTLSVHDESKQLNDASVTDLSPSDCVRQSSFIHSAAPFLETTAPRHISTPPVRDSATISQVNSESFTGLDFDGAFPFPHNFDSSGYNGEVSNSAFNVGWESNASLPFLIDQDISEKGVDECSSSLRTDVGTSILAKDIELPIENGFPGEFTLNSTIDSNSVPHEQSNNAKVERINCDRNNNTRENERESGNALKTNRSKRMSQNGQMKAKSIHSTRIRKKVLRSTTDSSESPVSLQSRESMGIGSRSTWDDLFVGRLDDSFSASIDTSFGHIRNTESNDMNISDSHDVVAKDQVCSDELNGQWASQPSPWEESPHPTAISSNRMWDDVVEVELVQVSEGQSSDKSNSIDLDAIKMCVKDTTGKSILESELSSHNSNAITTRLEPVDSRNDAEQIGVLNFPGFEKGKRKGVLGTFLERENAIAEYQELLRFTFVKNDISVECKIIVETEKPKTFTLDNAELIYASSSGASTFTSQHEELRSVVSSCDSTLQGLYAMTKELKTSAYVLDKGSKPSAKWAPTYLTMDREHSARTFDSNLPPADELCVAYISLPSDASTPRVSNISVAFPQARDVVDHTHTQQDTLSSSESLSPERSQASNIRTNDGQPDSNLLFPGGSTEDVNRPSGFDDHVLGPKLLCQNETFDENCIPVEIEIITDNALSLPKSPRSKKKIQTRNKPLILSR